MLIITVCISHQPHLWYKDCISQAQQQSSLTIYIHRADLQYCQIPVSWGCHLSAELVSSSDPYLFHCTSSAATIKAFTPSRGGCSVSRIRRRIWQYTVLPSSVDATTFWKVVGRWVNRKIWTLPNQSGWICRCGPNVFRSLIGSKVVGYICVRKILKRSLVGSYLWRGESLPERSGYWSVISPYTGVRKKKQLGSKMRRLFVGRLDKSTRTRDIEDLFEAYGRLSRCEVKYGGHIVLSIRHWLAHSFVYYLSDS